MNPGSNPGGVASIKRKRVPVIGHPFSFSAAKRSRRQWRPAPGKSRCRVLLDFALNARIEPDREPGMADNVGEETLWEMPGTFQGCRPC